MHEISKHRCVVCEKIFKAQRSDAKTCSNACRAKLTREKRKNVFKTQTKIINTVSSRLAPVQVSSKLSQPVIQDIPSIASISGKDLTECKRPDGKHFYTDKDLWILYSLLLHVVRSQPKLITILAIGPYDDSNIIGQLIMDFERRFECKFGDVKRSNPHIHFSDSIDVTTKYTNLDYSR